MWPYVIYNKSYVSSIRCLLRVCSIRLMPPSRTWEIPPRVEWSVVATKTLQVLH